MAANDTFFTRLNSSYIQLRNAIEVHIEDKLIVIQDKNKLLTAELDNCKEENTNLRKVSIVSNLNRQIKELTNELGIMKHKNNSKQKIITSLNIELEKIRDKIESATNDVEENDEDLEEIDEDSEEDTGDGGNDETEDDDNETEDSEEERYEIEIGGITYDVDSNNKMYTENNYVGDLINEIPYFFIKCYCTIGSRSLYSVEDCNIKIGKMNTKYSV